MRTEHFDAESRYNYDAFADFPVIGVDRNQTNAFYVKARVGDSRPEH